MIRTKRPRPVVLCILDGWGHRAERDDNAILAAQTPVWDRLMEHCPHALLDASAEAVGLPEGQMGNSEVGHMNLGAGRVVLQDLPRIDAAIADGTLARNQTFATFIDRLRASGGTAHLMGLVSPGGVHAHQSHILATANQIARAGVPVALHAFLDGRDTPPRSAEGYLRSLLDGRAEPALITPATVCGRYYAMDRDGRWDRLELAYAALVEARGEKAPGALAAIEQSYARGVSDEFVAPTVIDGYAGMRDGDSLFMANFRADRVRQVLTALVDPTFERFARRRVVRFAATAGMVEYSAALNAFVPALFPPVALANVLGACIASAGLTQLRIAETEKYAHVTFFFNGGQERKFEAETRILEPSPKVPTYDVKPEMSAPELTDQLVAAIADKAFDFIVVNYANTDMVGHTGIMAAAIRAVEAVDTCLGRLVAAVEEAGGALLITSDHGNAELMSDAVTGQSHTAHTRNLVPVVLVNGPAGVCALRDGRLSDVAPSLLEILRLARPREMTGHSLLLTADATERRVPVRASV